LGKKIIFGKEKIMSKKQKDPKFTLGGTVFWGIFAFIVCVYIVFFQILQIDEEAAYNLGVILGAVFFIVIIAVVIYSLLKTQQNTKEQLNISQNIQKIQEQVLTQDVKDNPKGICACCEKIVPANTMKSLKSNQLVCQQCYKTYCEPKLPEKGQEYHMDGV
jgi:hypothetical protein